MSSHATDLSVYAKSSSSLKVRVDVTSKRRMQMALNLCRAIESRFVIIINIIIIIIIIVIIIIIIIVDICI